MNRLWRWFRTRSAWCHPCLRSSALRLTASPGPELAPPPPDTFPHQPNPAASQTPTLEGLLRRPQIQLQRPRTPGLRVDLPVRLRDRVRRQHAVFAEPLLELRHAAVHLVAVDDAVDHDVRDVDALRAELARHAVGNCAQARLGRREGGEGGTRAQRGGGAREQDAAAAARQHATGGLAPGQEAAEAAEPPD